jgi:DNA primase
MGFSYSKSSIENLKNQVNIVDVVGRCVQLKRTGINYKGLCPFHNEKTPSFTVSESRQSFICFGCGAKGDVIEFVMKYYNLDFGEAVERLAQEYGIKMEKSSYHDDGRRARLYEINRMAAKYFYKALTSRMNPGYQYMKGRGMSAATLKRFGVGYADGDWQSLHEYLASQGVSDKEMLSCGLMSESKGRVYDKFRDRVIFPIINTSGKVIGFGGRAILKDQVPKYLNSPETMIFQKKNNLYGLHAARRAASDMGYIILVEGYMDAVSLYQSGIHNVCASLGTALTENQAKLLHRYTDEVVLSYDADSAGRHAALRGIEILRKENMKVKVLHVTQGKDPDEFVKSNGKDAFLKLIDGAYSYWEYKLDSAKQGFDLSDDEQKLDYLKEAAKIMAGMDPAEQEVYEKKLSQDLGISFGAIKGEVDSRTGGYGGFDAGGAGSGRPESDAEAEKKEKFRMTERERSLVKLMTLDKRFVSRVAGNRDMLETPSAIDFFEAAEKQIREKGTLDMRLILDGLEPEECEQIEDAAENVAVNMNDLDGFYADCVKIWEIEKLEKRVNELTDDIRLAEEEGEENAANKLSRELLKVNKELTERKRR